MTTQNASSALVSVVVPVRNDAATIASAVRSVAMQTYRPIELVLCDDGSVDGSIELAQEELGSSSNITTVRIKTMGQGAAAARNAAIARSTGTIIAFLDADDEWLPYKLACSINAIEGGADVVQHSEMWLDDKTGARTTMYYSQLVDRSVPLALSVLRTNPFSTSAVVMRKWVFNKAGPFDENLASAEDYDLWLRMSLLHDVNIQFVDDVLGVYRVREGSESSRVDARYQAMMDIGRRFLPEIERMSKLRRLEGLRYESRVRLACGVRYLKTGRRMRGAILFAAGVLQWPFHPEFIRRTRARKK